MPDEEAVNDAPDFEARVERHALRLRSQSLGDLEREVAAKRCAWLERERPRLRECLAGRPLLPRLAFELLFLDSMGLRERDLTVLTEAIAMGFFGYSGQGARTSEGNKKSLKSVRFQALLPPALKRKVGSRNIRMFLFSSD